MSDVQSTGLDAITEPPRPDNSRASRDMLIAEVQKVTNQVELLSVERIDSLIARLESLKKTIILDHRASVEKITSFIEMVDGGLKDTVRLEELTTKLEQSVQR